MLPVDDNTTIGRLRKWLRNCPALSPDNRFGVNYLAEEPTEYGLFAVPGTIAYKENVLGEYVPKDVQEVDFIFAVNETYGADARQNLLAYALLQDVTNWIIQQNNTFNFPRLEEGTVLSIVPTLTQYVTEAEADSARYQIQIKLKYRRR